MGKTDVAISRRAYHPWLTVFLVNLPMPLMMAWNLTAKHGRIGMAAAIVPWWYFGHRVCAESRGLRRALVAGGIVVSLAQVFPILHMLAGMVSLGVGSRLGQVISDQYGPQELTELGAFLVTMLTGGILITVALVFGSMFCLIFPDRRPRGPNHLWQGEG